MKDNARGNNAVVFSLFELPNNKVRIYMDDAKNKNTPSKGPWLDCGLVTYKDYDLQEFKEMNFSDEELAAIGAYVMARLFASTKHPLK